MIFRRPSLGWAAARLPARTKLASAKIADRMTAPPRVCHPLTAGTSANVTASATRRRRSMMLAVFNRLSPDEQPLRRSVDLVNTSSFPASAKTDWACGENAAPVECSAHHAKDGIFRKLMFGVHLDLSWH